MIYVTKQGTLWLGDAGWDEPVVVVDGEAPTVVLTHSEQLWLQACWDAATAFEGK